MLAAVAHLSASLRGQTGPVPTGCPERISSSRDVTTVGYLSVVRGGSDLNSTGLFRDLIDTALAHQLESLDASGLVAAVEAADPTELPSRLGELAGAWVERSLANVHHDERQEVAHQLLSGLQQSIANSGCGPTIDPAELLIDPISELLAIERMDPGGNVVPIRRPLTAIGETVLLTNARGEPALINEIEAEIDSADRIDLVLAFIRWTGIRKLIDPLRKHVEAGKPLRIITTIYTGSTEPMALERLRDLGAEIKVSYDTTTTRLHAKAWMFFRQSGLSTVYIGSSNLTHSAQVTGMEWNVRASEALNADVVRSFESTFETYWQSPDFEPFEPKQFEQAITSSGSVDDSFDLTMFDVTPYPFQRAILDQLQVERQRGYPHNLVVAATGTGKTVMAALDYRTLQKQLDRSRLLFIAHRKEILDQSRSTFRHVLKSGGFGEKWVDGFEPTEWDHVFASIQSLAVNDLSTFGADHFDVVIVDEFHHAAARTYSQILDWIRPQHLIGLTATPERADGLDITRWFEGRTAVELRLWDALEQGRLAPFHYFGIADDTDLRSLPWNNGRYAPTALEDVYTSNDSWVAKVLKAVAEVIASPSEMKALGFCVTIKHAEFMADRFNTAGIRARAVSANTSRADRTAALEALRSGQINALFAVDLFNEGVDIPNIDTVLMLRPTESATIFLQQLGRGLRKVEGKTVLTVLDFVGHQRAEFRFDHRFKRMLGRSRRQIEEDVDQGFPFLPAGCEINLDRQARAIILESIRSALPATFRKRVEELRSLGNLSLAEYLYEANLEVTDVYGGRHYWTSTRREAGHLETEILDGEKALGRGIGRLLHLDDLPRITFLRELLRSDTPVDADSMTERDQRSLTMVLLPLLSPKKGAYADLTAAMRHVWHFDELRQEMLELLDVLEARITHLHHEVDLHGVPLQVHATYSRDEVLAAFGGSTIAAPATNREGVWWSEESQTDVFFVTLDKSDKSFSPTTRYRDYAISDRLFHWESQAATPTHGKVGRRYINQREGGTNIAMFVRRGKTTPDGRTAPYFFAGLADYVSHTGDKPIQLTWRLRHPLPGDVFANFRAAVA